MVGIERAQPAPGSWSDMGWRLEKLGYLADDGVATQVSDARTAAGKLGVVLEYHEGAGKVLVGSLDAWRG